MITSLGYSWQYVCSEQKSPSLYAISLGEFGLLAHGPLLMAIQVPFRALRTLQRNALTLGLYHRKSLNSIQRAFIFYLLEKTSNILSVARPRWRYLLQSAEAVSEDLLTRRPHTWNRCCHGFSHPGPQWGHSLWCREVVRSSHSYGIHCTAPAKNQLTKY